MHDNIDVIVILWYFTPYYFQLLMVFHVVLCDTMLCHVIVVYLIFLSCQTILCHAVLGYDIVC